MRNDSARWRHRGSGQSAAISEFPAPPLLSPFCNGRSHTFSGPYWVRWFCKACPKDYPTMCRWSLNLIYSSSLNRQIRLNWPYWYDTSKLLEGRGFLCGFMGCDSAKCIPWFLFRCLWESPSRNHRINDITFPNGRCSFPIFFQSLG